MPHTMDAVMFGSYGVSRQAGVSHERDHRTGDVELEQLQRETFGYFLHETNPANGLVIDKTEANWAASIAATGLALACHSVSVERGCMSRGAGVERTLATLRYFWNSPQGAEPDATGYKGFYYHFLDMQAGRRAWQCELSTVDSPFLLAGALTAGVYFGADMADELHLLIFLFAPIWERLSDRRDVSCASHCENAMNSGARPGVARFLTGRLIYIYAMPLGVEFRA